MGCKASGVCTSETGYGGEEAEKLISRHPCYSEDAHKVYARMHLPVAPRCNVQCNFCNRRYDCPNESRPGVTSEILNPREALCKVEMVAEEMPNLSVVGIAGPGDPLANPEETFETLRLVKERFPDLSLCLSTNGLMLPDHAEEICRLGVGHLTVTVNMVNPAVGKEIYKWVRCGGRTYRGEEGAALLSERQLAGLKLLADRGVLIKVNIVMIPGVNDAHIPEIAAKVRSCGAFIINVMPMIPASGSLFGNLRRPTGDEYRKAQRLCENGLKVMRHCKQCRADAIGLLGEDRSQYYTRARISERLAEASAKHNEQRAAGLEAAKASRSGGLRKAQGAAASGNGRPLRFAVASKDNLSVNLHFGYAGRFHIWEAGGGSISYVEPRDTRRYCLGKEDCDDDYKENLLEETIAMLGDCDYLLCSRIGPDVRKALSQRGIEAVELYDFIVESIRKVAQAHHAKAG